MDESSPVLNHRERCDVRKCGAQARVRVYFKVSLHYLNFCGHHASEQPQSLFDGAEYVIDERALILGGA